MPEIASRQHVRDICGVVERALDEAQSTWRGPRCRRGHARARADRLAPGRRLVCEDRGLGGRQAAGRGQSPGGPHRVALARARRCADAGRRARRVGRSHQPVSRAEPGTYRVIGRTRDDAAGEAYDKVAKLLGLGYPGRADHRSAGAAAPRPIGLALPATRLTHPDRNAPSREYRFDFSFSGLKTAVLRHVRQRQAALGVRRCRMTRSAISRRAFRPRSWTRLSSARSPRRSGTTRVRSASPAACRRTRACGRARRTRRARRAPRVLSEPAPVDRQRRDDCRRRPAQARRRQTSRAPISMRRRRCRCEPLVSQARGCISCGSTCSCC